MPILQTLVDVGLIEVILPFILVFVITYAVLQRTQVFGKNAKRINGLLAFVFGFLAVLATNLLNVINIILFYFILLLMIGLLLSLVLGLSGAGTPNRLLTAIMIALTALFIFYGLAQAGIIDERAFFSTILWPLLALIAVGTVIYFATKKKKTPAARPAAHRQQQRPAPQREAQRPPSPEEQVTPEMLEEMAQHMRRQRGQTPPNP